MDVSLCTFASMHFAQPNILWLLLSLVIPVIIHLFYFKRYKKLFFSDIRLLREAQNVQKSTNRIKHLLVLISRILAMALLILAFAQPFLPRSTQSDVDASHISLFIDNSRSMEAQGSRLSLLEEAKQLATDLVRQYPSHYQFHIYDHELSSGDQRWIDQPSALNKIAQIDYTGQAASLQEIWFRHQQMVDRLGDESAHMLLLTDGQQNVFSEIPSLDSSQHISIVLINPVVQDNLSIDSMWVSSPTLLPGTNHQIYYHITNHSEVDRRTTLAIQIDNQTRPSKSLFLRAHASIIDTVPVNIAQSGWHNLEATLIDDGYRFDNSFYSSHLVSEGISALLISDGTINHHYRAAASAMEHMRLTEARPSQLIYSDFDQYDLIICDGVMNMSSGLSTELNKYVREGGNLFIAPPVSANLQDYNYLLSQLEVNTLGSSKSEELDVYHINWQSYLFSDVYRSHPEALQAPHVSNYYPLSHSATKDREVVLSLRNGDPYLAAYERENGHVYVLASSTDEKASNILTQGSFFIPMLHRMGLQKRQFIKPYYTLGSGEGITFRLDDKSSDPAFRLKGPIEIIPARYAHLNTIMLYPSDEIGVPGFYDLQNRDSTLAIIALDHNSSESAADYLDENTMEGLLGGRIQILDTGTSDVAQAIIVNNTNRSLWPFCLIGALLFLLIEQLLLRHYRR